MPLVWSSYLFYFSLFSLETCHGVQIRTQFPIWKREKGLGPLVDVTAESIKGAAVIPFCSLLILVAGKKREKSQVKSHGDP